MTKLFLVAAIAGQHAGFSPSDTVADNNRGGDRREAGYGRLVGTVVGSLGC
jgi:hypothetical protein